MTKKIYEFLVSYDNGKEEILTTGEVDEEKFQSIHQVFMQAYRDGFNAYVNAYDKKGRLTTVDVTKTYRFSIVSVTDVEKEE